MFNNLIESSSHRSEFKRRGSFFLFTTASYALLLVIAGVASIYAYDARLEDQSLEIVTMMPLVDVPTLEPPKNITPSNTGTAKNSGSKQSYFERKTPIANVDTPQLAPDKISTTPNPSLPIPKSGIVRFTGVDSDPTQPSGSGSETSGGNAGRSKSAITVIETLPPEPIQRPVPKVLRKRIINSEAISLPKPPYPQMAKQMRIQGIVSVQVLIDETGRVVSAKAISGSPFLVSEAQKAAYQARFSPTILGDQPVKVSGVITYNFLLQ